MSGFFDAFSPGNVVFIATAVLIGIVVGAIPGLSARLAIAVAVPLTFYMSPLTAIAFLVGIDKGGTFSGSITAILFNTPDSPQYPTFAGGGRNSIRWLSRDQERREWQSNEDCAVLVGADSAYNAPYVSDANRRAGIKPGERRQNQATMLAS